MTQIWGKSGTVAPNHPARRLFGALGDASENVSQIARDQVPAAPPALAPDPPEGLCHEGRLMRCRKNQNRFPRLFGTPRRHHERPLRRGGRFHLSEFASNPTRGGCPTEAPKENSELRADDVTACTKESSEMQAVCHNVSHRRTKLVVETETNHLLDGSSPSRTQISRRRARRDTFSHAQESCSP